MKRMRGRGELYGGGVFLISGRRIERKKNYKIKYHKGLRWPPFDILHATTNQKGMTEGGWDGPRNCARMLGEGDGNNEPFAEGDDDDDNKYGKDGNIPDNDNDEYDVGVDGVIKPLDDDNNKCDTLSAATTRACPESHRLSVPSC
jgi:hypothetical protein